MERYLADHITADLKKKMVFIAGPRQCGKTTIARQIMKAFAKTGTSGVYFNWDYDPDRRDILSMKFPIDKSIVVFDEIHKYPRWKNYLKGVYDTHGDGMIILVTGSARLDLYRRGGDSLLGRYHLWRLHPLSLDERPPKMSSAEAFKRLMTVGGFPEPFLSGDEREARRWRKERIQRIIRDDIRDLESVREIGMLEIFLDMLRNRVGGLVTVSNIAGDLQVAHKTVNHWLEIFEKMYLVFVVRPYTSNLPRAIQKPPKIYFYDVSDVLDDEGARFENLVAACILKKIHFLEDFSGHTYALNYIRDKEGREVDFAVSKNGAIVLLIEAKLSDDTIDSSLIYYTERLRPNKSVQVVANLKRSYSKNGIDVIDCTGSLIPMLDAALG